MMLRQTSIWVLQGRRFGDNQQMQALARATSDKSQADFICKQMQFSALNFLPNLCHHGSLHGLSAESRSLLTPPWPQMIITAGRRMTAAALWVRAQAGGAVRLVHIGRPWAPLSWFDLVITTAQYQLPLRENVIHNLMPLASPAVPPPGINLPALASLPRPWLAVAIGGSAPPYTLDTGCARRLAVRINQRIGETGGSALLLAGPRSRVKTLNQLSRDLAVPHQNFPWGTGLPRFADIAPLADNLLVTGDSAAMLANAATLGKPMEIFPLRWDPPIRYALVGMLRPLLPQKLFSDLISAGLITSLRDMPAYADALIRAGMTTGGPQAARLRATELDQVAALCTALLAPWRVTEPPRLSAPAPLFGVH